MTAAALPTSIASGVRTIALPARVLKRWDALAAAQLYQRAAELERENEELHRRLRWAEGLIDGWHEAALADDRPGTEGLLQTREHAEDASHAYR